MENQLQPIQVTWTRPAEFVSDLDWSTHEFRVDLGFHTYRRAFASIFRGLLSSSSRGIYLSSEAGNEFIQKWYGDHEDLIIRTAKNTYELAQSAFRYDAIVQGTSKETGQRDDLLRDVMTFARKGRKPIGDPKPLEILEVDWTFPAQMIRLVDGDTQEFMVDAGFHTDRAITMRLLGVNCPEAKGASRPDGLAASEYSRQWYAGHRDLVIQTRKDTRSSRSTDSFRRYLVTVQGKNMITGMTESLAQCLLATHHAVPFMEELAQ